MLVFLPIATRPSPLAYLETARRFTDKAQEELLDGQACLA